MPRELPIFDNHIHFRPEHLGVQAAKIFEKAGGTALLLTHSPYADIPIAKGTDYERAYSKTLGMAEAVRKETALQVLVALGPYPVEIMPLWKGLGPDRATQVLRDGIDSAVRHVANQDAVAIGEIGRPHFPVAAEIQSACNDLIVYTMERARERNCAVVLHTEDPTPATFAEFALMAKQARLPAERVVKHHSTPITRLEETRGIVPSILARETLVREALAGGPRFLLETDYIDDPERPGAVLGPATVPRKTKAWLESGLLSDRQASTIHKDLPERTYQIELV
jgi:TatD-related deoxyribonuclease